MELSEFQIDKVSVQKVISEKHRWGTLNDRWVWMGDETIKAAGSTREYDNGLLGEGEDSVRSRGGRGETRG